MKIALVAALACLLACPVGCAGEHRPARDKYNEGVAALAKREYDAAEKALLEARNLAGVDPELVFRAAYDLGVAYGAHADQLRVGKDADLAKALDLAQQSRSWFADAARLRPEDADTRTNLGIMRARVQAISDELRKGEGKLEVRLDRLIGDQRAVLEEGRAAWFAIKQAGGADPLAQQGTLTHLADRERGIVAEAGVVGDLAADEIDAIGKKPEDKRSDEEKVRVVQLKNVDLYLIEGRSRITEARRKLQELAAEDGVARAEAALVALKRAREQLLDPITVMKQIAQDELAVIEDTAHSVQRSQIVGAGKDPKPLQLGEAAPPADLPGWLEPPVIGERQGSIRDRLEEVRARLSAAVEAPAATSQPGQPGQPDHAAQPEDPKHKKLLERIKAALPSVGQAGTAMERAHQALTQKQAKQALEHEQAALEALALAIEQFSDLKQTIELAYGEHQQLMQLLSPEAAKQLDAAKRSKLTHDALAHNLARMPRIQELLADEVAQLEEQAKQLAAKAAASPQTGQPANPATGQSPANPPTGQSPPNPPTGQSPANPPTGQSPANPPTGQSPANPPTGQSPTSPPIGQPPANPPTGQSPGNPPSGQAGPGQPAEQADPQQQQLEQARQQLARAEELRGQAATALAALDKALSSNKDPMPPAKDADTKLTELRKLFFSVIEHLQDLIREQGETRDQTSAANGEDEFTRPGKLPGLIGRQEGHHGMAKAITDALAQQADAAGKQPAQQGPQQGPDPKALASAADEVRAAQGAMTDARANLVKARDATASTESLLPGVKSQGKAIEHLENALKILQPPPKKNDQQDQQQQQQQQQQQKPEPQNDQQQGGAGQRARDQDAQRQRERRERDSKSDPVEKDW
jgi:hypothetical protein